MTILLVKGQDVCCKYLATKTFYKSSVWLPDNSSSWTIPTHTVTPWATPPPQTVPTWTQLRKFPIEQVTSKIIPNFGCKSYLSGNCHGWEPSGGGEGDCPGQELSISEWFQSSCHRDCPGGNCPVGVVRS